ASARQGGSYLYNRPNRPKRPRCPVFKLETCNSALDGLVGFPGYPGEIWTVWTVFWASPTGARSSCAGAAWGGKSPPVSCAPPGGQWLAASVTPCRGRAGAGADLTRARTPSSRRRRWRLVAREGLAVAIATSDV